MRVAPTDRLYLDDDDCFEAEATVVAAHGDAIAFDRTCFYPGGGGQPHDLGVVALGADQILEIVAVRADADEVVWHESNPSPLPAIVGQRARLTIDRARRLAFARYHTALHVLNTIALRDYGGWMTGTQIALDYSRIDFKLEGFSAGLCAELEDKVNAVLTDDRAVRASYVPQEEFERRDDLVRTLEVKPPIYHGRVRVVAIDGFDAQACGGTHVHSTAQIGRLSIFRTENKGRINKRLYVRLETP